MISNVCLHIIYNNNIKTHGNTHIPAKIQTFYNVLQIHIIII